MAATPYRVKRRLRKAAGKDRGARSLSAHVPSVAAPQLVSLGSAATLLPAVSCVDALTVVVGGRYEVRVGRGFDGPTLAQLIRTLEQL